MVIFCYVLLSSDQEVQNVLDYLVFPLHAGMKVDINI